MTLGFRRSLYLLAGIAGLSLFLTTLGGLWQAHVAAGVAERIYLERAAPAMDLMKAVDALHRARQTILIALSEDNDEAAQAQLKKIPAFDLAMKSALQAYMAATRDQKDIITRLDGQIADYNKARDQSVKMIEIGDRPSALENIKSNAGPKFEKVLGSLSEVIQAQGELARQDHDTASADLKSGGILQIAFAVITLAGMAVLFIWITRNILRQLGGEPAEAAEVARRIARGDLSTPVPLAAGDSHSMMASMKSMQDGLADLIRDIHDVVASAEAGDLGQRLVVEGREGFSRDIGVSLNKLLQTADTSLSDIVRVAGALARGDLSQTIDRQYPGAFGATAQAVNATVRALSAAIDGVRAVVQAASESDYSVRMDTRGAQGYTLTLAELLNRLTSVTEKGLSDIQRVATALAEGDLTQRVTDPYPGLLGATADGMNNTVEHLRQLIGEVVTMVNAISLAAREISSGNQDLADRSSQEAASLQETAGSLEDLTRVVEGNTRRAQEVNTLVHESSSLAAHGGEVVRSTVQSMAGISQSAGKIGDIIGVIDSIAFQTNILALNAAVEAARAGEQGRGFAVVATEVRALAQRSATAAREIKTLIAHSVEATSEGTAQADRAGQTMDEIVASITRVTDIMASIAGASTEQASSIRQVSQTISSLDGVTQQNSALVEQVTAAAQSLQDQAQALQTQVSRFRLGSGALTAPSAPSRQKPARPRLLARS